MGWFAIAAILGFLIFWLWHFLAPAPQPGQAVQQHTHPRRREAWALVVVLAAFLGGLAVWVLYVERSNSLSAALTAIGNGQVARFLLGMPLGFGLGYFLSQGTGVTRADFIWLATPIAAVALVSPNLDGWLSQLTHFKSTFFELQLANNKTSNITYKVRVADEKETFAGATALHALADYHERIEQDIEYVRDVELEQLKREKKKDLKAIESRTKYLESAKKVYPVFRDLIGPIASCFETAIDGGLSIQRVRDLMVPATQLLQQIVFGRDEDAKHEAFWKEILSAPEKVDSLRVDLKGDDPEAGCASKAKKYLANNKSFADEDAYPRIARHPHLPYLHVAAAALLAFHNDTDLALRILDKGRQTIAFEDYRFLFFTFEFRYYQGEPAVTGIAPLEKLLKIAVGHQKAVEAHCRPITCAPEKVELKKRARLAEIIAMNSIAYRVAIDLARGIDSAKDLEPATENYARLLKGILATKEVEDLPPGAAIPITDTYAYTLVTIESLKKNPDPAVLKEMAKELRSVVLTLQNAGPKTRQDFAALNTARTHYLSARELAGE